MAGVAKSDWRAFDVGDIVIVRRGKHAGKSFVVLGASDDRILIANGVEYAAEKPKKKNVIHLQRTRYRLEGVAGRVALGKTPDNGWLAQNISGLSSKGGASCEQEETAEWPKKK